ncbi:hypothetical protein V6N13_090365 [Hibiscus sabdariffa]|uniref:Uncharacterized protein n=1 Tax=Hibiscus sabdariffa TaxID=183260 RepID=A0ABR2C0J2_9ROSI
MVHWAESVVEVRWAKEEEFGKERSIEGQVVAQAHKTEKEMAFRHNTIQCMVCCITSHFHVQHASPITNSRNTFVCNREDRQYFLEKQFPGVKLTRFSSPDATNM